MGTPILKPYLSSDEIDRIISKLAERINKDYSVMLKPGSELLVVVTLKGAFFFAADLLKKLNLPVRVDFVRAASYGSGTKSSGTVQILKDIETEPRGQHLLLLDEIVDSGRTLSFLMKRFNAASPASLKICALLNKPSRREVEVSVDYLGADVEDKFLVGYGLDHDEKYRNLKDIFYIENGE